MRLLVVGAGASYAQAEEAGLPEELRPPLMKNFAEKMWRDYNPHYLRSSSSPGATTKPGSSPDIAIVPQPKCEPTNVGLIRTQWTIYSWPLE
jgi:hypothetical protein